MEQLFAIGGDVQGRSCYGKQYSGSSKIKNKITQDPAVSLLAIICPCPYMGHKIKSTVDWVARKQQKFIPHGWKG